MAWKQKKYHFLTKIALMTIISLLNETVIKKFNIKGPKLTINNYQATSVDILWITLAKTNPCNSLKMLMTWIREIMYQGHHFYQQFHTTIFKNVNGSPKKTLFIIKVLWNKQKIKLY